MARRLALGLLLLLVLAAPAAGDPYDQKRSVDARIATLNERIGEARAREGALTDEISAVTEKIRLLQNDVSRAAGTVERLEEELSLHREKLTRLTTLLRFETQRLVFLRKEYAEALRRYNQRLIAIYQAENVDTVAVLLSASSFADLIEQLDYMSEVGRLDRQITSEVATAKEEMRRARERTKRMRAQVAEQTQAIAVKTDRARAERDRLLASQSALSDARSEKQSTLASVRSDRDEFLHEVEGLSQVSSQLAAQIQGAQATLSTGASSAPSSSGFIWPVSGPVTSPFGWRWGRMHEGIDIGAGSGTPIHAAASGTVISAGWLGGYGNLIVIDHGGGLATAYAHMSGYAASTGQPVAQGQTVGFVGCTGHCFGAHLHFEVRVNGAPVDPLGYL